MTAHQAYNAFVYYYPEQAGWWDNLEITPFYTTPDLNNMFIIKNSEYGIFLRGHSSKVGGDYINGHDHFGLEYDSKHHMKKGLALACIAYPEKFAAVFSGINKPPPTEVKDIVNAVVLRMLCAKNRAEQKRLTAEHKAIMRKIK